MSFIAIKKSTGERVDITKLKHPRLELVKGDILCQLCQSSMIVKSGLLRRPHFAHLPHHLCESEYLYHPESEEHLAGKELIVKILKKEFSEYSNATIEYEWRLPQNKRIADVAMIFPNGWVVVHECQLVAITIVELSNRTEDYLNAGIDVVWWLGKNADTATNQEWCLDKFGECHIIDFKELSVKLPSDGS